MKVKNKNKILKRRWRWLLFLYASALSNVVVGCYSFRGGSVPPYLKTIAIPIAEDQSAFGDPTLRDSFTKQLIDLFMKDNTLQLTDRNTADSMIESVITEVKDVPAVLQAGEQVAQRQITVTVRVTFQDLKLRKKMWEKTFSKTGNYPSSGGLTQRSTGIDQAVGKLTEDILNETVAGW